MLLVRVSSFSFGKVTTLVRLGQGKFYLFQAGDALGLSCNGKWFLLQEGDGLG